MWPLNISYEYNKEKLKEAEEKIREELKNTNTDDINNGDQNGDVKNKENSEEQNNLNGNKEVNIASTNDKNENNERKNYREKLKNVYGVKRYRIQEVIKPGQVILIQVIKEERGQKGAALTTFISLAGKYIVLMPNTAKGGGISRKIFNSSDRHKIRNILNEIIEVF